MIRFLEAPLVLFLLFLFVLASRFNVSPAISSVTAISRDQVACTVCSSCYNPCQPILSPPPSQPPPSESNCPPPPPPPESNCPPPQPPPSKCNCPPAPLPLPPPFVSGGGGGGGVYFPPPIGINFPEEPPPNPMMPFPSGGGMTAKCSTLSAIFPVLLILSSFIHV